MSAKFEYTVVKLPVVTKTREHDITELLNRVAAHGWRLVSVAADPGQYAYFERPAPADV